MKILILSDKFPPKSFGGAITIAFNLAKGLQVQGHKIFVITTVQDKDEVEKSEFANLNIFRIYINPYKYFKKWLTLYNPKAILEIKKIIQEIKPDIVHIHNIHQYLSYYCFKIAKKYAKAVFLTTHDVMLINYGKLMPKDGRWLYKIKTYNPVYNFVIRHYLKYLNKIFAVSDSLKELLEINGIKNIKTIHNGIDLDEWQIKNAEIEDFKKKYNLINKKVIIFSGRLIEAKGGDELIKSLALVKQKFSNFVLLVVGKQWAYTEKMKRLANEFGIGDKIIFTDQLEEAELKSAYHGSDISIFPSLCFETFGMANLEAMVCKKPVISSFFGGPSEVVVDGETGYLVDPNNIEMMADKIIDLLRNPEKARKFGEAGYERAKNYFSLNAQIKETMEWYRN